MNTSGSYRITSKEYIAEYAVNRHFKKVVDSGNFVFADNRLVINDPKYIVADENNNLCLTQYAENNQHECCLVFDRRTTRASANAAKENFIKSIRPRSKKYRHSKHSTRSDKRILKRITLSDVFKKIGVCLLYALLAPFVVLWFLLKGISFPFRWLFGHIFGRFNDKGNVLYERRNKRHDYFDEEYFNFEDDYEYSEPPPLPERKSYHRNFEDKEAQKHRLSERRRHYDIELDKRIDSKPIDSKPDIEVDSKKLAELLKKLEQSDVAHYSLDVEKLQHHYNCPQSKNPHPIKSNPEETKIGVNVIAALQMPKLITNQAQAPTYTPTTQNAAVIEHSEELKQLHEDISKKIIYTATTKQHFSQLAWEQMKRCDCTLKEDFRYRTLLSDKTFDRIKSGKLKNPDIETVMALCFGLDLGVFYGDPLLRSAGYDLSLRKRHYPKKEA